MGLEVGDGDSSSVKDPSHNYNSLGSFDVTLTTTSDSGCVKHVTKNKWLTVYPIPFADFDIKPALTGKLLSNHFSLFDRSKDGVSLTYDFGDGFVTNDPNPIYMYSDTGNYAITLKVVGLNGCADTAVQNVYIQPDFVFYIQNAFSPNGDGFNDTFMGKGIGIKKFNMIIFDRWGTLIYETNSMNEPWDGRANGGLKIAQEDIYVYKIELRDVFLQTHYYSGEVYLIK